MIKLQIDGFFQIQIWNTQHTNTQKILNYIFHTSLEQILEILFYILYGKKLKLSNQQMSSGHYNKLREAKNP